MKSKKEIKKFCLEVIKKKNRSEFFFIGRIYDDPVYKQMTNNLFRYKDEIYSRQQMIRKLRRMGLYFPDNPYVHDMVMNFLNTEAP